MQKLVILESESCSAGFARNPGLPISSSSSSVVLDVKHTIEDDDEEEDEDEWREYGNYRSDGGASQDNSGADLWSFVL